MAEKLHIVKVGGEILDNEKFYSSFLTHFSRLEGKKILVHGGGKMASRMAERLGLKTTMVEGRRVTDADALEVAIMVYGGLVNKKLVAQLNANGLEAIGLSGADAGLIQAEKRPVKAVDYGFVGDVKMVKAERIAHLLDSAFTPVFCALTANKEGQMFNTNADSIAAALAKSLADLYEVKLIYAFDQKGVLYNIDKPDDIIEEVFPANFDELIRKEIIKDGMIPKLSNALEVVQTSAVKEVRIGHALALESMVLGEKMAGTRIFVHK